MRLPACLPACLLALLHQSVSGPAEFKAAFKFCYDAAGVDSDTGAVAGGGGNPLAGLFAGLGGLLGGGRGGSPAGAEDAGFPEEDVKVLKGLDDLLLRLNVVYPDAEERAGMTARGGGSASSSSSRR